MFIQCDHIITTRFIVIRYTLAPSITSKIHIKTSVATFKIIITADACKITAKDKRLIKG